MPCLCKLYEGDEPLESAPPRRFRSRFARNVAGKLVLVGVLVPR